MLLRDVSNFSNKKNTLYFIALHFLKCHYLLIFLNNFSNKFLPCSSGQLYNEKLQEETAVKQNLHNNCETSLLKNIQPKTNMEKFKCVKCDNLFTKLSELEYHLKWHKSQKQFKCVHCNVGYKIERNLELHLAMVHSKGNLTKCPICHVSFTSQRSASLKSHLMLHQIEELYTCDKCKSEFDHEVSIMFLISSIFIRY